MPNAVDISQGQAKRADCGIVAQGMDSFLDQESAQDAITKRGRLLRKQRKKELRGERRDLLLKVPLCVSGKSLAGMR